MKLILKSSVLIFLIIAASCSKHSENKIKEMEKITNVDIQVGNIKFDRSINISDNQIIKTDVDKIELTATSGTDLFLDPKGIADNKTAPMLLKKIDNSKPFTFTAKVSPQFKEGGLYDAGGLIVYSKDDFWQKVCFEQDERGYYRIVTVKTLNTSDDNNHDRLDNNSVYLRFSSDTQVIGSYYSVNGEDWQLVRIYKNEYPREVWIGLSSQAPKVSTLASSFEVIKLKDEAIKDFRMGK